jgi:hypothetical protein
MPRSAATCPRCDHSKFDRTADGIRVCADCGLAVPTQRELKASTRSAVTVILTKPTKPPVKRTPRVDPERPNMPTSASKRNATAASVATPKPKRIRNAARATSDAVAVKRAERVDTPAAVTHAFDKLIAARRAGTSTARADKLILALALSPLDNKRQAKAARARARRAAAAS